MDTLDKNAPIGVFDSGVGGLTVAREIIRQLPNESIVYFGDTARVPYGSKSKDTIIRFSRQIVNFLKSQGVKAIVIACNTASALALDVVSAENDIPIIGVIEPGARAALSVTESKKIGVIGTEATIRSQMYDKIIQSADEEAEVIVEETIREEKPASTWEQEYLKGLYIGLAAVVVMGLAMFGYRAYRRYRHAHP